MRRRYQLSKIGKEKRKSGLCRLCWPLAFENARWRRALGPTLAVVVLAKHVSTPLSGCDALADGAGEKKLPQVGQVPVGAIESEHECPVPFMVPRVCPSAKRFPGKTCGFFRP